MGSFYKVNLNKSVLNRCLLIVSQTQTFLSQLSQGQVFFAQLSQGQIFPMLVVTRAFHRRYWLQNPGGWPKEVP